MKTTTVTLDRGEDQLEIDVEIEESITHNFWGYSIEAARLNGDNIAASSVELTSREESVVHLRCVEAAEQHTR